MSTQQPSEEELRAAYEAQIKQVRVEHVLLDNVVMLINLGMRRTGLMPGTEAERDAEQVRLAIESVRALMPLIEAQSPGDAKQVRDALSQLQLAYLQISGAAQPPDSEPTAAEAPPRGPGTPPTEPASSEPPASNSGEPGPAQRSGRLWVPGQ